MATLPAEGSDPERELCIVTEDHGMCIGAVAVFFSVRGVVLFVFQTCVSRPSAACGSLRHLRREYVINRVHGARDESMYMTRMARRSVCSRVVI